LAKSRLPFKRSKVSTFAFDNRFADGHFLSSIENFSPDRIIIESSGSAFPATLAFQIRELERETGGAFKLDAIVTVIDAENFTGYEDTSTTARMQAAYTDMLLIVSLLHLHCHIRGH